MSLTFFLFLFGGLLGLATLVVHFVLLVQGFKTSVGWGLIVLLLGALGGLIFAFGKWGRRGWAVIYLVALLGSGALLGVAAYQTALAAAGAAETTAAGMQEAEEQIEDLSNVENIQLDL